MTIVQEGQCGLTRPPGTHIEYDCREAEQLYGIGYHKVCTTTTTYYS